MLSMPNHAAITASTISGTQMKPAFCTHTGTHRARDFARLRAATP